MIANRLTFLLLAVGILIPACFILWFTNRAADREADAARREVAEVYQQQLRKQRDLVNEQWQEREQALANIRSLPDAVNGNLADSVIFLNADGTVAYPIALGPMPTAKSASDSAQGAITRQTQIRDLVLNQRVDSALQLIESFFINGDGFGVSDIQGRRVAGDELLLAAQLSSSRRMFFLKKLTALLNDYKHNSMPSAQRLFLMEEARKLGAPPFTTFAAERLAGRFLESDSPASAGTGLLATNLEGVWKMKSRDGRVLALFNTETIRQVPNTAVHAEPGATLNIVPPGQAAGDFSVPAASMMPGWLLEFTSNNTARAEAESSRRRAAYLWTGYMGIAAVVLVGLLLAGVFRRQMQLARLKTDLVSTVSHELKTPLASTRLLVDNLLSDANPSPTKSREYLQLISSENQRLIRLVENFLAFSRMERRKMKFTLRRVRPDDVVNAAVNATNERFEIAGGAIIAEVEPGLPALHADPDALTTVLVNLLDNALKYSPDDKRALVRAGRDGHQVVFSVIDHGIGIEHKEHRRIFREFYQVDQSLARSSSGCGLGLHIVEHIVNAHGGEVCVTSEPGKGSTFSVWLPEAASV